MKTNSKYEVAVEFGYASPLVSLAMTKQEFSCAGDLIIYLEDHEDELQEENKKRVKVEHERIVSLRKETELLYRSMLCLRCRVMPRTVVLLPCAHFCLCSTCEQLCRYCPVSDCNSYYDTTIKTYMS